MPWQTCSHMAWRQLTALLWTMPSSSQQTPSSLVTVTASSQTVVRCVACHLGNLCLTPHSSYPLCCLCISVLSMMTCPDSLVEQRCWGSASLNCMPSMMAQSPISRRCCNSLLTFRLVCWPLLSNRSICHLSVRQLDKLAMHTCDQEEAMQPGHANSCLVTIFINSGVV